MALILQREDRLDQHINLTSPYHLNKINTFKNWLWFHEGPRSHSAATDLPGLILSVTQKGQTNQQMSSNKGWEKKGKKNLGKKIRKFRGRGDYFQLEILRSNIKKRQLNAFEWAELGHVMMYNLVLLNDILKIFVSNKVAKGWVSKLQGGFLG